MKASVLVVLYNRPIDSIVCLASAAASPLVGEVVVCDNSTAGQDNAAKAEELGIKYLGMGGNAGLPKAYNAGFEACTGDVVCVFDDDTEVGADYFEALASLWDGDAAWDIALPLVVSGDIVLSPYRSNGYRAHRFSTPDEVRRASSFTGINSGMAVRKASFGPVRYDEGLFLDFVDQKFVDDALAAGLRVVFLDGPVLKQDFSLLTSGVEASLSRLRIFEKDSAVYYSGSLSKRAYRLGALLYRKAKLSTRFKTLRFFSPHNTKGCGAQ